MEIWKSLLYHLSADCTSTIDSAQGKLVWRVSVPLLSTVLNHAHFSDHNLPAPLAIRVKDLINTSLNEVLKKVEALELETQDYALYCSLSSSLVEVVELISTYRGFEFEDVNAFRDQSIQCALKRKDMTGYSSIMVQGIRGKSVHTKKIWKTFHKDILCTPGCLKQLLPVMPRELLGTVLFPESTEDLVESPMYSALLIFSELNKFRHDKLLGPVLQLELWTDPDNWNSLQSGLGLCMQRILDQVYNLQGESLHSAGLKLLLQLPVEYLPRVQKLGLAILCIKQLISGEEIKKPYNDLLCRNFEETDVFRFINFSVFLEKILTFKFESFTFLEILSGVVAKYSKMMTEVSDALGKLQEGILTGNLNHLHFFVYLLENLSHPILHVGVVKEKKSIAEKLSLQITKVDLKIKYLIKLNNSQVYLTAD